MNPITQELDRVLKRINGICITGILTDDELDECLEYRTWMNGTASILKTAPARDLADAMATAIKEYLTK